MSLESFQRPTTWRLHLMDLERATCVEIRAACSTILTKNGTGTRKEDLILSPKREDTIRETEKGRDQRERTPRCAKKSNKNFCPHFQKVQWHEESIFDFWHPPECSHCKSKSVDAIGGTRVCSSPQAKRVRKMVKEQLPTHRTRRRNSIVY